MRKLPPRMQNKLYNDQLIPDETLELREKYRRFAEDELLPQAYQIGQKVEDNANFLGSFSDQWQRKVFSEFRSESQMGAGIKVSRLCLGISY